MNLDRASTARVSESTNTGFLVMTFETGVSASNSASSLRAAIRRQASLILVLSGTVKALDSRKRLTVRSPVSPLSQKYEKHSQTNYKLQTATYGLLSKKDLKSAAQITAEED
ncbi:alanine--tRNA ligase [Striga asiatica]|uniref:Alanine--tRNA ligase n=1 Tax=Striga asiatica TaxID=4170 RepID=A0A5A7PUI8_STRAF|nr:alanine--tRNA ligase [Striga asiatica]